jgi:hypothetical protein
MGIISKCPAAVSLQVLFLDEFEAERHDFWFLTRGRHVETQQQADREAYSTP